MAQHNDLGNEGEKRARAYLREKGYRIRHLNWRYLKGELDIVAETEDQLVVVEVKSRSTEFFEHPNDAITNTKIRNIVNATQGYIETFDIKKETRFDVVSVIPKGDGFLIEHVEDAFFAPIG